MAGTEPDKVERAFEQYLRTGVQQAELAEFRAQSEGTNSAGGYLVPQGFRNKLVERMKQFGGIATEAEIITTSEGNLLPYPTVDDTANVGEIVAEGGTFAAGAACHVLVGRQGPLTEDEVVGAPPGQRL